MTRNEIMNSIALKKRFCKDCNLPITVFDNPYFYERLQTIDIIGDCVNKFDVFCLELQRFKSERDYFEYYNKVKDSMIAFIKAVPEYKTFNNTDYNFYSIANKKDLYVEQNDGQSFISIDMKKANFSAMKHYSDKIFDNSETWEQFVSKFTYSQHIINSKYIRQVVLGACNPKKQIKYELYLMNILCKSILNCLPTTDVYSLGEDEIIIRIPESGLGYSMKELKRVINNCHNEISTLVRVEYFMLEKFEDGWIKIYNDNQNRVDFKCVNAEIYHQIIKHYYNEPITENDLVFRHNNKLAKFINEVNNPWS